MKAFKSIKIKETSQFLHILEKHYSKMLTSPRLYVWEEVIRECHQNGILLNRDSQFLYRTRWPAFTRTALLKWKNKKKMTKKDEYVISIHRMLAPRFCKNCEEEEQPGIIKAADVEEELIDDNDNSDYEDVMDSFDDDRYVSKNVTVEDENVIKEAVEYMVNIVSDCQDVMDSLMLKCADIPAAVVEEAPVSTVINEQHYSETSNESSNVLPPSILNGPAILPNSHYYPQFFPSLTTTCPPPPSPLFYSEELEQAQLAALQAYTVNCQWATYKFQLEVEALKKLNNSNS